MNATMTNIDFECQKTLTGNCLASLRGLQAALPNLERLLTSDPVTAPPMQFEQLLRLSSLLGRAHVLTERITSGVSPADPTADPPPAPERTPPMFAPSDRDVLDSLYDLVMVLAEKVTGERPAVRLTDSKTGHWIFIGGSPSNVRWGEAEVPSGGQRKVGSESPAPSQSSNRSQ